jgi:hypothetical protein
MLQRLFVLMLLACAGFASHASLLFEPYGGYAVGTLARKYSATFPTGSLAGTTESASVNGFGYGGRVGFLLHHFVIIAGEYQAISAKEKSDHGVPVNWDQHTTFATLGFQAPRGFRLMGSYGFDAQVDESTLPDKTQYKGTAMKFALGWHLPMAVAINIEYSIFKFTDQSVNGVSAKMADLYDKFDYSTVKANISFPFEFGMGGRGSSSSGSRGR